MTVRMLSHGSALVSLSQMICTHKKCRYEYDEERIAIFHTVHVRRNDISFTLFCSVSDCGYGVARTEQKYNRKK